MAAAACRASRATTSSRPSTCLQVRWRRHLTDEPLHRVQAAGVRVGRLRRHARLRRLVGQGAVGALARATARSCGTARSAAPSAASRATSPRPASSTSAPTTACSTPSTRRPASSAGSITRTGRSPRSRSTPTTSLYFTSGENRVYAIDARTGKWKWQYDREAPESFTIRGYPSPLVVNGRVYVGFSDGYLACLSAGERRRDRGRARWPATPRASSTSTRTPLYYRDTLYVSAYATGVYALDPKDGSTQVALRRRGRRRRCARAAARLYFTATKSGLHALDLERPRSCGGRRCRRRRAVAADAASAATCWSRRRAGGTYVADARHGRALSVLLARPRRDLGADHRRTAGLRAVQRRLLLRARAEQAVARARLVGDGSASSTAVRVAASFLEERLQRRAHVGIDVDADACRAIAAQAMRTPASLSVSASTSARAVPASRAPPSASAAATRARRLLGLAELHHRLAAARLVAHVDVLRRLGLADGDVEPGEVEVGRQIVGVERDDVLERRAPARSRLPAASSPSASTRQASGSSGVQHRDLLVGGDGVGVVAELAVGGAEAEPGVGAQVGIGGGGGGAREVVDGLGVASCRPAPTLPMAYSARASVGGGAGVAVGALSGPASAPALARRRPRSEQARAATRLTRPAAPAAARRERSCPRRGSLV